LSVVLLLVKGNFQAVLKIAEGVSHLNLALSKGETFPGFKLCDARARVPHHKRFLGDESQGLTGLATMGST
jgi:hypothetical protein